MFRELDFISLHFEYGVMMCKAAEVEMSRKQMNIDTVCRHYTRMWAEPRKPRNISRFSVLIYPQAQGKS
jgi:hypothetical protein